MPALTYEQLLEQRNELAELVREAAKQLNRAWPAGGQFYEHRLELILPQEAAQQ